MLTLAQLVDAIVPGGRTKSSSTPGAPGLVLPNARNSKPAQPRATSDDLVSAIQVSGQQAQSAPTDPQAIQNDPAIDSDGTYRQAVR